MKENIREILIITIGFILVALAVQYFYVPSNIAGGGITGIALVINHHFNFLSIGVLMLAMNIILFIVAFFLLGSSFGGKTLYASFGLSGAMWFIETFMKPVALTQDIMLSAVIGTIILGVGLALVFSQNASTGGTDILAKILNKFFHLDMGKCMQSVDMFVVILAGITFGISKGLYAVICVLLNGIIIDKVIEGFNACKEVTIIANEVDIIKHYITNKLDRGCTVFKAEGGYTGKINKIIYCVMERGELIRLRGYIKKVDPTAFVIVTDAHEVMGRGFGDMPKQ
jgi:uncharacterized membrane-anchored protein YitT (DUF2179 family)